MFHLQFSHPEKSLGLPGVEPSTIAPLYGLSKEDYENKRQIFMRNAHRAALDLLDNQTLRERAETLPFQAGQVVVGLGDSITDDLQSWLEILQHLYTALRPDSPVRFVNAGVSGDTTADMISRFLEVVKEDPDWILCMPGTNDARRHGLDPTKTLVSSEETQKNLQMIAHYARKQTRAQLVWMTPATVIPEKIATHFLLSEFQVMWDPADLKAIAEILCSRPEPVVDLQQAFGHPVDPRFLLPDGLHPSLAGQKQIVQMLIDVLGSRS